MTVESQFYVGLMSGTSVDGVDGVLVSFDESNRANSSFDLLACASVKFEQDFRQRLISLNSPQQNEIHLMNLYANEIVDYYQEAVDLLIESANILASKVRVIGMHGQTIRHQPRQGYSVQIGNAALLAEKSKISVATDFRSRDIAAGGQGAPIAPVLHSFLWHQDRPQVVVNLGGIANITLLTLGKPAKGFDTGPANVLLDSWIQRHLNLPYDHNGEWASSGQNNEQLLYRLLDHDYFNMEPPKSTGRDDFNLAWLDSHLQDFELPAQDVQATLLKLTAKTISDAIRKAGFEASQVILCGGGCYNLALLNSISELLPDSELVTSDHFGIDPVYVEALAFALLAKYCVDQQPVNLTGVTGARGERISGCIYYA